MPNYFASNLKYLRVLNKMTKTELAKKLNVHQSTISRWENNEMGATVDNAIDVSNVLKISLPKLLGIDLRIQKDVNDNEYDDKIKQYAIDKDIKLEIGKNAELTASDVLKIQSEVNKILMDEMHSEDKN